MRASLFLDVRKFEHLKHGDCPVPVNTGQEGCLWSLAKRGSAFTWVDLSSPTLPVPNSPEMKASCFSLPVRITQTNLGLWRVSGSRVSPPVALPYLTFLSVQVKPGEPERGGDSWWAWEEGRGALLLTWFPSAPPRASPRVQSPLSPCLTALGSCPVPVPWLLSGPFLVLPPSNATLSLCLSFTLLVVNSDTSTLPVSEDTSVSA